VSSQLRWARCLFVASPEAGHHCKEDTAATAAATGREMVAGGRAVAAWILAASVAGRVVSEQEIRLQWAVEPADAAELAGGAGGHPSPLLPTRGKGLGGEERERGGRENN
jgi:hypothetical protein